MTHFATKLALWFVARMYELRILVASANVWILRVSSNVSPLVLCVLGMILVEKKELSSIVVFS